MVAPCQNPLVSVIVPVYNGAEFIAPAVESVLKQSYRNLEVIVVDDGSTDSTLSLLEGYARADERMRILVQPNGGVARARNRAIAEARGEFIAPIDADDLWDPGKIQSQVNRLVQAGPQTGFVYCWWVWIDEKSVVLDRSPRWHLEGDIFDKLLQINFTGNASVPLFRRKCLLEIGGYNAAMADARAGGCEDWEVVLSIASKYAVAVVAEPLVGYRRRPGSMSTACQTMRRSHQVLIQNAVRLGPAVSRSVLRQGQRQYMLYLAGLSFWSGNLIEAIRWGLRSGWRLPLLLAPHILKLLLGRWRKRHAWQQMRPGHPLDRTALPAQPLLPYDRVYKRLGSGW